MSRPRSSAVRRERFRSSGYDHPNATFRNENQIVNVLGQILEGVVRSGILWDLLRGGFGTRSSRGRPDFGAPNFPFPFPTLEAEVNGEWKRVDVEVGHWLAIEDVEVTWQHYT